MPSGSARILVVDDEPPIRRLLRTNLVAHGYVVEEAQSGAEALAMLAAEPGPDLVILDLGLPDFDGVEIVRRVRRHSAMPIVILSARDSERAKVQALDEGADDYVTKPFGIEELMARIRTALRHRLQTEGATPVFRNGDLSVDLVKRIVRVRGEEVRLSPKEYEVLRTLVMHAGKVLTHAFLLKAVWGSTAGADSHYLRIYVRALRQKIEADPTRPAYLLTETGVGYRLAAPDER